MALQVSNGGPGGKSVGAATIGIVVTLLVFVAVFIGFLIAPLLVLLLAFLGWSAARARGERGSGPGSTAHTDDEAAAHGFGTGTR
ncbi:MAG: hypothetical protein ABF306_02280 [Nocardioides marinisabuli]|uniref:hypothetical protein n=1 Tax=Nocardioides marinisabuli TaxID=419476 RepID=UPI0032195D04